jgi:hypothetical protein
MGAQFDLAECALPNGFADEVVSYFFLFGLWVSHVVIIISSVDKNIAFLPSHFKYQFTITFDNHSIRIKTYDAMIIFVV